ncbi:hypothetical protein ACET3Z_004289 [Daucus carota]
MAHCGSTSSSSKVIDQIAQILDSLSSEPAVVAKKNAMDGCQHFSIRRYVADTRETDPKACNPFGENNFQTWQLQLKAPLDVPLFKWWRCTNCQQSLITSDAEGDGSKAPVASDPQGEIQDMERLHELARIAVLLEEKESAEEGQACNLPSKSTGEPSHHHQEKKRKTVKTATGVSSRRRQRNPKRIVTEPERHEACILNQNPADYSVPGPQENYMIRGEDLKLRKRGKRRRIMN